MFLGLKLVVFLVRHGFQPFVGGVLACDFEGQVGKPAVGSRAVPVLHVGGDVDDRAGQDFLCRLAFLLVPAASGYADQHLSAALRGLVDVPVVAAAWLEGDVGKRHLCVRDTGQVAVAREVAAVGRVRFADGENHRSLEGGFGVRGGRVVGPYVLGQAEGCPCLGPSGVEGDVGDNFGDLRPADAVLAGRLQVVGERRVGHALADEGGQGDEAAVAQAQEVVAAPYLSEEDVVVQAGKLGGELAQLVTSGCLYNFLLCHTVQC